MLYCALLAGGLSSRMGKDKKFLDIEGKTLLQRSLDLLAQTGSENILLSGNVRGLESSYEQVSDVLTDCGPLGGIHAILHHIHDKNGFDGSLLLIIPVDMPMLDVDCLNKLVEEADDADCIHYEGEIFPCVFRLKDSLMSYLDELFRGSMELGGDRSMKSLLKHGDEKIISPDGLSNNIFLNLNRPEDLVSFRAIKNI